MVDSDMVKARQTPDRGRVMSERDGWAGRALTIMTVQEMVTAASRPWVMVSGFRGYLMLSSSQ